MTFGVWDYTVVTACLVISGLIGIYYRITGDRQRTTAEYLLGGRELSITPVAISLMASFMSAITILGVSAENYYYGSQFIVINIGYGIVTPIIAYGYLPVFFDLQTTSAYEYLELRFGGMTRLTASIAFSLQMVLYMGIVLYAPALALEALTGLSRTASILIVGLVCTFYSTLGGIKAVVATDVFQALLMLASVFLVLIKICIDYGGFMNMWNLAQEGGRIQFDNISPDPLERHTWWSLNIGGAFTYLTLYAVNQTQVQRLLTLKSLKKSQIALWLAWPVLSLLSISTSLSGIAIYVYYKNCDPLLSKRIASSDQLMPQFVMDSMGSTPGIQGLFAAGIFSGSLSTVSSALNSLAAVTLEDYLKPIYSKYRDQSLPENKATLVSKILAFSYGLVCLAIAFAAQHLGGILQASLTIFGVVGGPLLALFTLGMFTVRANQPGVLIGIFTGLSLSLWIGFSGPKPPPRMLPLSTEGCPSYMNITQPIPTPIPIDTDVPYLYRISYLWYVVISFAITLIIGYIASLIYCYTSSKKEVRRDARLYSPLVRRWLVGNNREIASEILRTGSPTIESNLDQLKGMPTIGFPLKDLT